MGEIRYPVEAKVKASTAGAFLLTAAGLELLTVLSDNPGLIAVLPGWLEPLVLALLPTLGAFAAGYRARHTPRSAPAVKPVGPAE